MILEVLTAFFTLAVGSAALFCLALGLLSLSQHIETHAARARRIGLRILYAITFAQLLIIFVDGVPFLPLLPTLFAGALHYRAFLPPTWPFTPSPNNAMESLISLVILPLSSHIYMIRSHTRGARAWHQHRYDTQHRPKLPGGRLDWDVESHEPPGVREMTNLQVCAVLAICVWSVPVYRLLGRIAVAELGSAGVVMDDNERRR